MNTAAVAVVDDDASVRQAYMRMLRLAGHKVQAFDCANGFLCCPSRAEFGCLILDVQLPDLDGLELQSKLRDQDQMPPIVFLTAYGDIRMTVRAMRSGAVDFLTKPCTTDTLLDAVDRALQRDQVERRETARLQAARARVEVLTPREREVLGGIVAGLRNKQIAAKLDICEKTVKVHRARVMDKTGAGSVAELVRIAQAMEWTAGVRPDKRLSSGRQNVTPSVVL